MKPVNTEALSKWVGNIPPDVLSDMAEIAPMLARLGYDPHANPPDYKKVQPLVSPLNYSKVRRTNFSICFHKEKASQLKHVPMNKSLFLILAN